MDEKSLPPEIEASLRRLGVFAEGVPLAALRLTGGVSSDIWRVTGGDSSVCVKRAMPKLAVKDDWFAPVERNRYERQWYATAGTRVPGTAPKVLAHDDAAMFFVMEYLDPAAYRLWKPELLVGKVDVTFAGIVGGKLAAIHAATAGDAEVARAFPTDAIFEALRLESYLRATGRRHPDLAPRLEGLADRTAATKKALVHGDVSPKNMLKGPAGHPVFLDAECAWYGDPAFDLAFCLNHLLLKCLHAPAKTGEFLAAFDALRGAYVAGVTWEAAADVEGRTAALLPGLLLARVDGKSPVEYLTEEVQKESVRRVAIPLIREPPPALAAVRAAWAGEVGR